MRHKVPWRNLPAILLGCAVGLMPSLAYQIGTTICGNATLAITPSRILKALCTDHLSWISSHQNNEIGCYFEVKICRKVNKWRSQTELNNWEDNNMISRRAFVIGGLASLVGLGAVGGAGYLAYNQDMNKPSPRETELLADLHCHIAADKDPQRTLETLSQGVIGMALLDKHPRRKILDYSDFVQKYSSFVEEVDKGILARVHSPTSVGYVIKTQEVRTLSPEFHILAVGIREYLPPFDDPRKAVKEIHQQGAIAIFNHPYVIATNKLPKMYRLIRREEESMVKELSQIVDAVEVFNGHNINLHSPSFLVPNMNEANEKARQLAEGQQLKMTAASDTHWRLEQAGTSGIWVPKPNFCFEALKEYLCRGDLERQEQYISITSVATGLIEGIIADTTFRA